MKARHILPLLFLKGLLVLGCETDQGGEKEPIEPPTGTLNIGGCTTGDCGRLTWDHRWDVSRETFIIGFDNITVLNDPERRVEPPTWHFAEEFCLYYGCDPEIYAKHADDLFRGYSVPLHNDGFIGRKDREYHAKRPLHAFVNFLDDDYEVTNYLSDGTTQPAWPCFTDSDREHARAGYLKMFKQLHPRKTQTMQLPNPETGFNEPHEVQIGF